MLFSEFGQLRQFWRGKAHHRRCINQFYEFDLEPNLSDHFKILRFSLSNLCVDQVVAGYKSNFIMKF